MLNQNKKKIEGSLKNAFESGYSNAAASLSKMIKDKICFNNSYFGFHRMDSNDFSNKKSFSRNESNILITTEIFGDVTGKSYFLISDREFDLLTHGIPEGRDPNVNLKEEFAKELDNILSASVITKLSNELNQKMYGDIPVLVGKVNGRIEDIIYDDFNELSEEIYVNSTFFLFENNPDIMPFFVWVVDSSAIRILEPKSVI